MDCYVKLNFKDGTTLEFDKAGLQVLGCGVVEISFQEEAGAGLGIAGMQKVVTKGYPLSDLKDYEVTN